MDERKAVKKELSSNCNFSSESKSNFTEKFIVDFISNSHYLSERITELHFYYGTSWKRAISHFNRQSSNMNAFRDYDRDSRSTRMQYEITNGISVVM